MSPGEVAQGKRWREGARGTTLPPMERVLEPEYMDTEEEARDYGSMDHSGVNQQFAEDLLAALDVAGRSGPVRLLDLGTGPGDIPLRLLHMRPELEIVAVDAAATMLDLARNAAADHPAGRQVQWQQVDIKMLPFADGSFDGVFSNTVLHHIPRPEEMLAEARRVTAAGGLTFLRDLYRPADLATAEALQQSVCGDAPAAHQQLFLDSLKAALTLGEIRQMASTQDWDSLRVEMTSNRHWTLTARA